MDQSQPIQQQAPFTSGGGQRTRDQFSKFLFQQQLCEHQDQTSPSVTIIDSSNNERPYPRQSSLPNLPMSISSSSASPSSSSNSDDPGDSMNSCNCTESKTSQSSDTSQSSSTSSSSSIRSSREERKGNRRRQSGPNPFAFF
mmetsp:Transcript_33491/g.61526  ORF Transcript_33491/g.61526 Transcript_33491/m.61526 type:complete len:142 (-) Transcript_33491:399-824(-)